MPEPVKVETILQGSEPLSVKNRPDIISVDNANFNEWADRKLGLIPTPEEAAAAELVKVEAEKAARLAAEKADKEADEAGTEPPAEIVPPDLPVDAKEGDRVGSRVYFKGKWVHKNNQNYRFHVKTAEAESARNEAKAERERAAAATARVEALTAKYEPPKSNVEEPEPQIAQFANMQDFLKSHTDWAGDKARREDSQKAAQERIAKQQEDATNGWNARWKAATENIPDFSEVIDASPLRISDELRDATFESEFGPQIRYHLAKNVDYAEKIGKMTVAGMLKELGKLEDKMAAGTISYGSAAKPQSKSQDAPRAVAAPVAEISKAHPPITPLNGGTDESGLMLRGSDPVPANMTYEQWKAARQARRIR